MYNDEFDRMDIETIDGPVFEVPDDMGEWSDTGMYGEPAPPIPGGKHNPNKPKYIQPTDMGYPGLEPPVG